MLHNEARALILKAWDKTHNADEIVECFSVARSTVYRLVRRRDKTGEWQTRTHLRGRKPALSAEQKQEIIRLVEEQPDITINEIVQAGYTYKKKSMHAKEQERPQCRGETVESFRSYL